MLRNGCNFNWLIVIASDCSSSVSGWRMKLNFTTKCWNHHWSESDQWVPSVYDVLHLTRSTRKLICQKSSVAKKTPKKIELGTWLIDWLLRIAVVISYTPENLFFQIVPTQFCNLVRLRKWQTEDSSCRQVVDCYLFRNKNK